MFKKFTWLLMIALNSLLMGCGPSLPQANLAIQSAQYLNPDVNGRPSPVEVTFYELSSASRFKHASYYSLSSNAGKVLGNDLIDVQTMEVRPGQTQKVTQTLSPNTHYIGLTAAYRNLDQDRWKTAIKIPNGKKDVTLNVVLESQGLAAALEK